MTVVPGRPGPARVAEVEVPREEEDALLARARLVGACCSDREIQMVTRPAALSRWPEALERQPDDIEVVVDLSS